MNNNKQLKWINVDTELPANDRIVLVWINDTENPQGKCMNEYYLKHNKIALENALTELNYMV